MSIITSVRKGVIAAIRAGFAPIIAALEYTIPQLIMIAVWWTAHMFFTCVFWMTAVVWIPPILLIASLTVAADGAQKRMIEVKRGER